MGHFFQCVGILAGYPGRTVFCILLFGRIHLGTKQCNADKRTLFDKAISLLNLFPIDNPFYLLADSYYSVRKMLQGLIAKGGHIITRVRSSAVAWFPAEGKKGKRGRPKKYGKKIKRISWEGTENGQK